MSGPLMFLIIALAVIVPLAIVAVVLVVIFRGLRGTGGLGFGGRAFATAPLAIGTVVSARRTGLSVNDIPQMAITLDVERPDGPPFRAEAKQIVSPYAADSGFLRPGATVPVRYLVESSGQTRIQLATDAPQADVQRVLSQVQLSRGEITATQLQVAEQGIPAQAVVLDMRPTGEVRSGRSVLRLDLQVNPYDSAPFTAMVEKAVPQHALGAVQVGSAVPVRYLPEHPNDLVIELPAN